MRGARVVAALVVLALPGLACNCGTCPPQRIVPDGDYTTDRPAEGFPDEIRRDEGTRLSLDRAAGRVVVTYERDGVEVVETYRIQ